MNDRRLSSNCRLFSLPTSSNWRAWVRLVCFAATAMTPLGAVSADKGGADTSQASAAAKAPADATTNPIAEAPPVAKSGEPTAESVAAQIKQLEAAEAELPDRAKLLEIYHQALDDLKQAAAQKAHADELEAKRAAAPNQLKLRKAAASAAPAVAANLPADAALANWEQLLDTAEQELETAQKTLAAKEDEERHRATRRLEIPQEIATARMKLDMLDPSATDATAAADDSPAVAAARQIALAASRHVLETEIALLEKEQQTYDDTASELLSLEHDAAAQTVEDTQKRVAAWRESVNKRREAEAERQAQEAHWAAANAEPAVRSLAEENSTLADRHSELTKRREELSAETDAVTTRLNQILDDFKHIEDKVGAHGSKEAVGYLLRKQRSELAAIDADRRAIGQRQEEIAKVQMELIDLQETSTRLRNLDNRVKEFIAALPPGSVVKPDDVRTLLKSKRKYIDALTGDESAYFSDLYELDTTQEKLVSEAEDELKFIDENVLWTRSAQPLSPGDAKKAVEAAAWLVRPANWLVAAQALVKSLRADVGFSVFIGVVLAGWFVIQTWLRRAIGKWSSASTPSDVVVADDTLRRACQTSIATLLIAALWPSTLWILGSFIAGGSTLAGDFPQAAGKALQIGAAVLLPLLFVRQICRRQGLGESHFGWSADALLTIRRQLNGLIVVGTPLAIVVAALEVQATDAWKDSLGRLLFIAGQLLVASLAFTAFRPAGKSLIGGVPQALPVLPD
jgi:potassium efflux system protein